MSSPGKGILPWKGLGAQAPGTGDGARRVPTCIVEPADDATSDYQQASWCDLTAGTSPVSAAHKLACVKLVILIQIIHFLFIKVKWLSFLLFVFSEPKRTVHMVDGWDTGPCSDQSH